MRRFYCHQTNQFHSHIVAIPLGTAYLMSAIYQDIYWFRNLIANRLLHRQCCFPNFCLSSFLLSHHGYRMYHRNCACLSLRGVFYNCVAKIDLGIK